MTKPSKTEMIRETESLPRTLAGFPRQLSLVIGAGLALFTFYTAACGVFVPLIQRSIHLCAITALIFLWYPFGKRSPHDKPSVPDLIFCSSSLAILAWILLNVDRYMTRIAFVSPMHPIDVVAGITLLLLIMETVRRTIGWTMIIITCIFIVYAFLGPWCPGILMHKGMSLYDMCDLLFLTTEGFFGSLTGTSATVIYCFVGFGAFLHLTGADQYFMRVCLSIAGKRRGGPAKVAVLSSALFGCISGSTIANVVTTGTLTIPLMKKTGYEPHVAGAVETAASSAGQIMPPVMGTSVFIMAEILGIRYLDIVKVSYIPAILYFASVWFFVDLYAQRRNISGCDPSDIVPLNESLKNGLPMFLPIILLISLMAKGYTPFLSGFFCTLLVALIGLIRRENRYGFRDFIATLENCSINMCSITATIACASVMIALINKTGLMLKMTSIMLQLAGNSSLITIAILAVLAYVLGTALPVSTCYVVLATLGASAMISLNIDPLNAHMMIQWFTQLATITPPVCLTAFAAANIAHSDPMQTGNAALKLGLGFYYIPFLFVYTNLLTGPIYIQLIIGIISLPAIYLLVAAIEGFLGKPLTIIYRALAIVGSVALYLCNFSMFTVATRIILFIAGMVIFGGFLVRRKSIAIP